MRDLDIVCEEYLMVALTDGAARAQLHLEIAGILTGEEKPEFKKMKAIHDKTQAITGDLQESIGYPEEIIRINLAGNQARHVPQSTLKELAKRYAPKLKEVLIKEAK